MDINLRKIVPRDAERALFARFLGERLVTGEKIEDRLLAQSVVFGDEIKVDREEIVNAVIEKYKRIQADGGSTYETLVLNLIKSLYPSERKRLADIRDLSNSTLVPDDFPGKRKNAEVILRGKIASDIKEQDVDAYYREKRFLSLIRGAAREMFVGICRYGLTGEKLINYLRLTYDLELLGEAPPVLVGKMKELILSGLNGQEVTLVHIKCLRMVYPKSGGLQILTDTADVEVDGVLGRYCPKSERNLFPRLEVVQKAFTRAGIKTRFVVCVADNDIDLLYPEASSFVKEEHRLKAKEDAKKYLSYLARNYDKRFELKTITSLMAETNGAYDEKFIQVLRDIRAEKGNYVPQSFMEHDRLDHQLTYYKQLLGKDYDRSEARRSIYEQTASTIALSETMKLFGDRTIMIEENRGGENKLIAGGTIPVIFTKLRDEAKFGL